MNIENSIHTFQFLGGRSNIIWVKYVIFVSSYRFQLFNTVRFLLHISQEEANTL